MWSTFAVDSTNSINVWWIGLNFIFPVFIIFALIIFKLNDGALFDAITDRKPGGVDKVACTLVLGPGVLDSASELLCVDADLSVATGVHSDPPQSGMHKVTLLRPADQSLCQVQENIDPLTSSCNHTSDGLTCNVIWMIAARLLAQS